MLTDDQVTQIAFAAFQTHYRLTVINDENVALQQWQRNGVARTLWTGIVHSILANSAIEMMLNEPKEITPEEAIKRAADPAKIGEAMAAQARRTAAITGRHSAADPNTSQPPSRPAPPWASRSAVDLAPGLAIGRCTETPETPANATDTAPSDPAGDAG